MKPNLSLLVLLALNLLPAVAGSAADAQSPHGSTRPLVAMSGADSHITKPSYQRITRPETWARVWASHLGTSPEDAYRPLMEVDFDRCMIIAIFQGDTTNARGIRIDSAANSSERVVIRFTELGYQTAGEDNEKPPDRPYAFVIIPTTHKAVVLEASQQNMMPRPPEWREVAILGAEQVKEGS